MKAVARRLPLALSFVAVALWATHLLSVYEELPQQLASHFDLRGRADGFQQKSTFLATTLLLQVGQLVLFAALPRILRMLPPGAVNIPARDYWLAPARRLATIARLTRWFDWFGLATLTLTSALFALLASANLAAARLSSWVWLLLALYLGFTLSWAFALRRAFARERAA
jgi:hypothetical protein